MTPGLLASAQVAIEKARERIRRGDSEGAIAALSVALSNMRQAACEIGGADTERPEAKR